MIVGLFHEIDEGRATAMAESKSMTIEQVVREVMAGEHADVLRESVRLVVQELMNAEVSELIGAELGERTADRATWRNGYRSREWDTRVGVIELQIPKLRQGSYFPHGLLEPRKRGEQALLSVVQQAYVCGVSTRRVDQLVETLGLRISRSEVSRICALLDEQVEAFRQRPLEGDYPYLWLDAKVEKVRNGGRVVGKAVVIAYGVHETGRREILGVDVGAAETEPFWSEFLRSPVARGLAGVPLVVSDAHEGLKNAIAKVLGCPWQRCMVHFLRDCPGHVRRDQHGVLAALIRPTAASLGARRGRPTRRPRRRPAPRQLRADRQAPRAQDRQGRNRPQDPHPLLLRPARRRNPLPGAPLPAKRDSIHGGLLVRPAARLIGAAGTEAMRTLGRARPMSWPPTTTDGRPLD
jgi:transposase-like protein